MTAEDAKELALDLLIMRAAVYETGMITHKDKYGNTLLSNLKDATAVAAQLLQVQALRELNRTLEHRLFDIERMLYQSIPEPAPPAPQSVS